MAKKTTVEDEVTGPRLPASDHRNHCLICGGVADHVHSPQPEKPEPRAPRKAKPGPDEPSDDDDVLVVELEPEMVAAMGEAGEVELSVELEGDGSGEALPPYDPENPEQTWEPPPEEPEPEPEPNRRVHTQGSKRDRK